MTAVRPMLAVKAEDLDALPYPLLASVKLDGIRCLITPDGPQTRSGEPIPNDHVRELLSTLPVGLDGELCCMDAEGKVDFRLTTGNIRRKSGKPSFTFFVFDNYTLWGAAFLIRNGMLMEEASAWPWWCRLLPQRAVFQPSDVRREFEEALHGGNEGLILRHPMGLYKHGRSTLKSADMLKVKPYEDAEAVIVSVFERMANGNEATKDKLGHTKRSDKKAGDVPTGMLGGFRVVSLEDCNKDWGVRLFEVSAGKTTHAEKKALWDARESLIGKVIRYQFVNVGGYDKPRHGTFQGFREAWDMDR